ncbi:MAG: hypothetical protein CLLPBCKN_004019 [Chroococcidiopsis cubana SAG 39.79]|nr:hypothetical protein [Chroococcidiopsis cubana]MDZ4874623.1 hypothetical protein [Chroococcidiopsis cubana SAG 39.79]
MSDGAIHLHQNLEGRSISVTKFRGSDFRSGLHFMRLTDRGMEIFPRLQPEVHKREFKLEMIPSGVPDLDELMHGGIEREQ